jgi:hypothetical protein
MFSGVWSPDKIMGLAVNEKAMGGTKLNRILIGDMRI